MKTGMTLMLLLFPFFVTEAQYETHYNFDYSQTLVMKVDLAIPDRKGGSIVFNTFEDALEIIKKADQLSLGVPKIVYLVGWQYNGHDDKYPAFFEVNRALKRPQDSTARESLLWLMKEARKYHTVVSLHINMTDAYEDSPLWETYVKNDLISKRADGSLMVIGNYNGRKAYQVNYRNEWNKGFTKMRIDSLLELLPLLREAGTIHIDAWIARESRGHHESAIMEAEYQKKALAYWRAQGIDVTSEWVMDYMTGLVPFAWHFNGRTQEDYLRIPAYVYTGSGLNPDVRYTDFGLGFLFGKSMYGETVFPFLRTGKRADVWEKLFVKDFYLNCLQYFFLNRLRRLDVKGAGDHRVAEFSCNVKTSLADSTVTQGPLLLREKDLVFFPVVWSEKPVIATYSTSPVNRKMELPQEWRSKKYVLLYKMTDQGRSFVKELQVKEGVITLVLSAGVPYLLEPGD